jgi:hypothetical protein
LSEFEAVKINSILLDSLGTIVIIIVIVLLLFIDKTHNNQGGGEAPTPHLELESTMVVWGNRKRGGMEF